MDKSDCGYRRRFRVFGSISAICFATGLMLLNGCTVVTADRVFPKVTWSWSRDAKLQRESDARQKAYAESVRTNSPAR